MYARTFDGFEVRRRIRPLYALYVRCTRVELNSTSLHTNSCAKPSRAKLVYRPNGTDGRTRDGLTYVEQHPIKYVEQHPIKYVAPLILVEVR